jgi:hypothetical protein
VATNAASFRLLITGSSFKIDDVVQLDGVDKPTDFISATQLATTVDTALLDVPKIIHVTVRRFDNSATSAPLDLTVTDAKSPAIVSLAPAFANVGDPSLGLIVTGRNFTPQSVVTFDNSPRSTTFISATELRATIPASDLDSPRTVPVTVINANGVASPAVLFSINQVIPVITALNPSSVISGEPGFQLVVTGTNFSAQSVININGVPRATQVQASTGALTTDVAATEIAAFGTLNVTVTEKGAVSDPVALTVRRPTITAVLPGTIVIGDPVDMIEVRGDAFLSTSKIIFKGVVLDTSFASSGGLVAKLDPSMLLDAGQFAVVVKNSDASLSTPFFITISGTNPPHIDAVTPQTIAVGSDSADLKITGSNFVELSQVKINGRNITTRFVSVTEVHAALQAADLASIGGLLVTVTTPSGGTSNAVLVSVSGEPPPPGTRRRPSRH